MEIRRYWALIWRWAWLVLLGTLLASATAYLVSRQMTPIYRASARLLIDEAPGTGSGNEYSQVLLEQRLTLTYIEILKTRPVLEETIERLGLPFTTDELDEMVTISAPQDTQIIVVSVEGPNPGQAAEIADAIGQVFIDQNQARESLRYAEPIANWQRRQNEIGDEIEALETEINTMGTPQTPEEQAALSRLETKLNEAQIRYTEAFNNLNSLQISQAKESSNVVQIEPAQPSRQPVRPRTLSNTILAGLTGGMLALGIVFLIEYLDDTVKTPDQVMEDSELSTLGSIAVIRGASSAARLIASQTPRDPISEAYRVLRTNLSFSAVDGGLHSLIVTSASPGEGKSTTVANLAVIMAQAGHQVIVVDADLRRPTQHKFFEIANSRGLTTAILDSETTVEQHLHQSNITGVRILTSGPIPPNPAELLSSQRMSQILAALRQEADIVIFDSPPTMTVADASILVPQVDGCLLVVEAGKTRRDVFVQAVDRLRKAKANLFGVVINQIRPVRSGYYYNYYYNAYADTSTPHRSRRLWRLPTWLLALVKR